MHNPGRNGSYDVIIVGAGIIGLSHAFEQMKRNKRVAVFERAPGIFGASIRNFGHIGVTTQAGIPREYAEMSRERWVELASLVGFWHSARGATVVARSSTELALLEEFADTRGSGEVVVLGKNHIWEQTPVRDSDLVGGAQLERDLQVDSRVALPLLAEWLEAMGVDFFWNSTVQSVHSGQIQTASGSFSAEQIFVAVNYAIDQFFPGLAQSHEIQRCNLQMMSIQPPWETPIQSPILTGWSMLRYSAFQNLSQYPKLRSELHMRFPEQRGIDLNQMYAQRRDGSLVVGDSHVLSTHELVFQEELTNRILENVTKKLFGLNDLHIIERWQGVYATGRDEFLCVEVEPAVWVTSVTTGLGMSCGPGFVSAITKQIEHSENAELRLA